MKSLNIEVKTIILLIVQCEGLHHTVSYCSNDEIIFYCGDYTPTMESVNKLAEVIQRITGLTCSTGKHPNGSKYIVYS